MLAFARVAAVLVLASSLSGCLTLAAYQLAHERREIDSQRFNAEDYAWSLASGVPLAGSVTVTGRSGPRANTIAPLTCAGRDIELVPDSPHMRHLIYLRGHQVQPRGEWRAFNTIWNWPEIARPYVRVATCDDRGAFRFPDVPDGAYILLARIQSPDNTGADTVVKPVRVHAGARLDLSFDDDRRTGQFQNR